MGHLPVSASRGRTLATMAPGGSQLFRQLFDRESCTYTYLLADAATREGVLIDPVIEHAERDANLVKELGLNLKYVINTHVHADHITGTGKLKSLVPGCKSILSKASTGKADILLQHGDKIKFGNQELEVLQTPGHTEGCVCYVDHQNNSVYTGDAVLIRGCGRTAFQGGSAATLYDSVWTHVLASPTTRWCTPPTTTRARPAPPWGRRRSSTPGSPRARRSSSTSWTTSTSPTPRRSRSRCPPTWSAASSTCPIISSLINKLIYISRGSRSLKYIYFIYCI